MENRVHEFEIMEEILNRWSPRAFDPNKKVSNEDFMALLEAARFAPSCFNEQPWRFIIGNGGEDRDKIVSVLAASNQEWASKAPAFIMVLSHKNFAFNQKENRWHLFDTGTAWGYLSLEAQRRGMITHAMGGFKVGLAREAFDISEEYDVIAVIAIGYYGNIESLSPEIKEREKPSPRKSMEEIIFNK